MWKINGTDIDLFTSKKLIVEEVLFEFDGPKIFTHNEHNRLHLIYESDLDEDNQKVRFIASPTDSKTIEKLKEGNISVHDALAQPWVFALETDFDWNIDAQFLIADGIDGIPEDARPEKGILLWSNLEAQRDTKSNDEARSESATQLNREFEEFAQLRLRIKQDWPVRKDKQFSEFEIISKAYRSAKNNYYYKFEHMDPFAEAVVARTLDPAHAQLESTFPVEELTDLQQEALRLTEYKMHIRQGLH